MFFQILTIEILDEFYSTLWLKSFFPYLRGHKKICHQIVVEQRHLRLGIWMFLQSAHLQIFSPMSGQQTSQYLLQIHKPFSNWQCSRLNKNLKNNYIIFYVIKISQYVYIHPELLLLTDTAPRLRSIYYTWKMWALNGQWFHI